MWQDWILMLGGFVFSAALIPAILSKNKPSKWSCGLTGLLLFVFAYVYFTLDLLLSALSTTLTALAWFVLLRQSIRMR